VSAQSPRQTLRCQISAAFGERLRTLAIDELQRATRPGRKADAEDRANVEICERRRPARFLFTRCSGARTTGAVYPAENKGQGQTTHLNLHSQAVEDEYQVNDS
jgi:hypothetical protein